MLWLILGLITWLLVLSFVFCLLKKFCSTGRSLATHYYGRGKDPKMANRRRCN